MFADLTARYENLGLGGMIDLCTKDEIVEIFDIVSIKKPDFHSKFKYLTMHLETRYFTFLNNHIRLLKIIRLDIIEMCKIIFQ